MRNSCPAARTRAYWLALAALVGIAPAAEAAAIPSTTYLTYGQIDSTSGAGFGQPIQFYGTSGTLPLTTPSAALPLGSFQVEPLPASITTTYDNTPFTIYLLVDNTSNVPGWTTLVFSGILSGTVGGPGPSSMVARIGTNGFYGTLDHLPFPLADLTIDPTWTLAPASVNGGQTPLTFSLSIPEPTPLAAFGLVLVGLGLWRVRTPRR